MGASGDAQLPPPGISCAAQASRERVSGFSTRQSAPAGVLVSCAYHIRRSARVDAMTCKSAERLPCSHDQPVSRDPLHLQAPREGKDAPFRRARRSVPDHSAWSSLGWQRSTKRSAVEFGPTGKKAWTKECKRVEDTGAWKEHGVSWYSRHFATTGVGD